MAGAPNAGKELGGRCALVQGDVLHLSCALHPAHAPLCVCRSCPDSCPCPHAGCPHTSPALGDAPVHLRLLLRAPWLLQDEEEERRGQRGAGDGGVRSRAVCVPCCALGPRPIGTLELPRGHFAVSFLLTSPRSSFPQASPSARTVWGCLMGLLGRAHVLGMVFGRGRGARD